MLAGPASCIHTHIPLAVSSPSGVEAAEVAVAADAPIVVCVHEGLS